VNKKGRKMSMPASQSQNPSHAQFYEDQGFVHIATSAYDETWALASGPRLDCWTKIPIPTTPESIAAYEKAEAETVTSIYFNGEIYPID
jgi:hypothetical protein